MITTKQIVMIGPFSAKEVRGGVASVIASYMESTLVEKYDIHYLHTSSGRGFFQKFLAFWSALGSLTFLVVFRNIQAVHIHTASWRSFYRKLVYVCIAKLLGAKVLLHIHGGQFNLFYEAGGEIQKKIISWALNASDHIVVLSPAWVPDIQKMTTNHCLSPLANPVNLAAFCRKKTECDTISPHFDIVFLGELSQAKGIYDLLSAFPEILKQVPNARLQLCGLGPLDELREICRQSGIEESVIFCGWVSGNQKRDKILDASILVLPSYNEGLPVSVIEAMAAGLPVVCTPVGGVPDMVSDGINGFLFEPGDKKALASQIIRLAKDPLLREKIGATNVATATERFDLEKIVTELSSLYEEISKDGSP